jgi:5'(3')-deoxyribonucleotidase
MLTIVWDVDDVLNDLMQAWLEQAWLLEHPSCSLHYETITENPPNRLLGVSLEDYLNSLDAFRLSVAGQQLSPVPEVKEWFQQHGYQFRHVALTARPIQSAALSAAWVIHHFGEWIRSFGFVPSYRQEQTTFIYDRSKVNYLRWWGRADILIDDGPINLEAARQLGICTFLMPRPWNQSQQSIAEMLDSVTSLDETAF